MTTGKTTALPRQTSVSKVMSLLFNMLSRLVITFPPRSKSFNFIGAVTVHSGFGAQENKVCHCFHCFLIYLPWYTPKELQTGTQESTCIHLFTVAVFTTAQKYKEPKNLSTNEWINKSRYIRCVYILLCVYYSFIKRNEVHWHVLHNEDESQKHTKFKKPDIQDHILQDFIYMKSPE